MEIRNVDPVTEIERVRWILDTASDLCRAFILKYTAGQLEHKGDLGGVPVRSILDQMEDEAIDQLAYVRELKRRLTEEEITKHESTKS